MPSRRRWWCTDQPHPRPGAAESAEPANHRVGDRRPLLHQGDRIVFLRLPDGRCRSTRRHGSARQAVRPHPGAIRDLLHPQHERSAALARVERCGAGAAGRLGDRRGPAAGVACASRLCRGAVLACSASGASVPDGCAHRRLSARSPRAADSADCQAQSGGAGDHVARRRRDVLGSPDCEGVQRRGTRDQPVSGGVATSLPDQHARRTCSVCHATRDGVPRGHRHGRRPLVWQQSKSHRGG